MSKLEKFVTGLEFGKRYYKPNDVSWNHLEFLVEYIFRTFKVHKMRGDMFCLKCTCCGSTEK